MKNYCDGVIHEFYKVRFECSMKTSEKLLDFNENVTGGRGGLHRSRNFPSLDEDLKSLFEDFVIKI